MITNKTKYSELYDALFEKATERLAKFDIKEKNEKGELVPVVIHSLEEYFSHLDDLVNGPEGSSLSEKEREEGYLFLKLPLDEPPLIINANDRTITVPDNFKKNGLSVVGDVVAEIVFFEIDRFYDATDLSLMQIGIEWENSKGTKGRTPAFIRDIESKAQEDKLIFGWPITAQITDIAGKIKFAVRFYQLDIDDKIVYSFSTLPQTITINSSLDIGMDEVEPDDATSIVLGRVLNSPHGAIEAASQPYFVYYEPKELLITRNFNNPEEGTKPLILAVLGQKLDNGSLGYNWFHNNISQTDGYKTVLENGAYIEVKEWIKDIAIYYKQINDKYEKIECLTQADFEAERILAEKLYVLCSIYELTAENIQSGTYSVELKNAYYGTNAIANERKVWTVEGAKTPKIIFSSNIEEKIIDGTPLKFTINDTEKIVTYSWNKKIEDSVIEVSTDSTFTPVEEAIYNLTVTNIKNNDIKSETSKDILCTKPVKAITKDNLMIKTKELAILTVELEGRDVVDGESISYVWQLQGNSEIISREKDCNATPGNTYQVTVTISKGSINSTSAVQTAKV